MYSKLELVYDQNHFGVNISRSEQKTGERGDREKSHVECTLRAAKKLVNVPSVPRSLRSQSIGDGSIAIPALSIGRGGCNCLKLGYAPSVASSQE